MAASKNDRDKKYMQSLKAERAVKNSENKSPSYSTRARTAKVNRLKRSGEYSKNTNVLKDVGYLLTRKSSPNEKARSKVESAFIRQSKAEDKDMARRRNLVKAKKNVNKRIK